MNRNTMNDLFSPLGLVRFALIYIILCAAKDSWAAQLVTAVCLIIYSIVTVKMTINKVFGEEDED